MFDFSQKNKRGDLSVLEKKKGKTVPKTPTTTGFNNKKTNYSPQYKSKKEDKKERK